MAPHVHPSVNSVVRDLIKNICCFRWVTYANNCYYISFVFELIQYWALTKLNVTLTLCSPHHVNRRWFISNMYANFAMWYYNASLINIIINIATIFMMFSTVFKSQDLAKEWSVYLLKCRMHILQAGLIHAKPVNRVGVKACKMCCAGIS